MIEGVKTKKLKVIPDERGKLMEMLRADDELFEEFGQVYVTTAFPGVIKGWHYHKLQTDNLVPLKGEMKVVLYDSRKDSKTFGEVMEFFVGERNPMLIQVPPYVFHGFKAVGTEEAYLVNVPTKTYNYENPDEYRVPADSKEVPYSWELRQK